MFELKPIEHKDFVITEENRSQIGYTSAITNLDIPANFMNDAGTIEYTVIGIDAFAFCGSNLVSVDIPDTVKSIGTCAFLNSHDLQTVKLPSELTVIKSNTFADCRSLTRIVIPDSVTVIEDGAFDMSSGTGSRLQSIQLSSNLISIRSTAFNGCKFQTIKLPETLQSIGFGAFAGCSELENINIPKNVKSVGQRAFYRCENLKTIKAPRGCSYESSDWCGTASVTYY